MLTDRAVAGSLGRGRAFAIFALALMLRWIHVWQIEAAPFSDLLLGDARGYDLWAREIVSGSWLGTEVFYQAPLYPYFLSVIYSVLGDQVVVVRVVQSLIGAVSCVLLASAGAQLFSRRVGLAAGGLLALYAPAIFFDGLIQKSALDLFGVCLVLWLISRATSRARDTDWLAVGISLGVLALTRENALVFCALIPFWVVLQREWGARRWSVATFVVVGVTALLLPVAIRNAVVGGEFHLTTSQFGTNFFIGNNAHADGTYRPLRIGRGSAKVERQDARELAEAALGRDLTPGEVSSYWTGRATDWITSHPVDWMRLTARKFFLIWNAAEIADTEDPYTYAEWSTPLRWLGRVVHLGTIAPLAVLGAWLTWGRRREIGLLAAMLAVYLAGLLLFYVFARYRYPIAPVLILFAAAGAVEMGSGLRDQSMRQRSVCALGVLVAAVFCNWPLSSEAGMRSSTLRNIGIALASRGELDAAIEHLERALDFDPDYAQAHVDLGSALQRSGRLDRSIDHYRLALVRTPGDARARGELATALSASGRHAEAIQEYQRALALDPRAARVHYHLGLALSLTGEFDEARTRLRAAFEIEPALNIALAALAFRLATHPEVAQRRPARALRLAGWAAEWSQRSDARTLEALAAAHASLGQFERAREIAREGLARASDSGSASIAARLAEQLERYRTMDSTSPGTPAGASR